MSLSALEPLVGLAVAGVARAIGYVNSLPRTVYDSELDVFRYHAYEAMYSLRRWAEANEIQEAIGHG